MGAWQLRAKHFCSIRMAVLRIRIQYPVIFDLGSGISIRDWEKSGSGSGIGKNLDPDPGLGSGMNKMNIPDHFFECLETVFGLKILKFFVAGLDPGSEIFLTLDPG